jgi:diaminopimelate decarboxylase
VNFISDTPGVQARFAMKACPVTKVLREMKAAGIWIDAGLGQRSFARVARLVFPRAINRRSSAFTADVFRDNALAVVLENKLLPNIGSPGMVRELRLRVIAARFPCASIQGFGHGHVNACDTGGPSSKHGIWIEDLAAVRRPPSRRRCRS